MLTKGILATDLKNLITQLNQNRQDDANAAIDQFCNKVEECVYTAIQSLTITVPPGALQVVGSPSAQANATAIVLENVVE